MDSECAIRNISDDDPAMRKCFSPKTVGFKYVGLVVMCLMGFEVYFCYDNPGALQDKFEIDLNMSASKFSVLYSAYAWPNVIICFFGGFLLDRVFGIRWGTIIYASLVLCGQLLFAVGTFADMFWLMVLGRFIFGSGAESLIVAQHSYVVIWFRGKALNTLFGLQLSFARLGSTVNFLSLENIYKAISETSMYTGPECIGIVLFLASIATVVSMMCALLLGSMDSHADKVVKRNYGNQFELVKVTDMKDFKMPFWLTVFICAAYYISISQFMSFGKLYFMTKYELDPDAANTVISLVYTISAVASPLFGILVDKTGNNILWVLISLIGSIFSHGLLAFTYVSPYVCMVLLGISYSSFASSLWPMIALAVPEHQLGTAYGITQAFQNLDLAVMSIVCGIIVDNHGYIVLEMFFLVWLLISLVLAVVICASVEQHLPRKT